jgi:magnesium transporter
MGHDAGDTLLGAVGFARIVLWQHFGWADYGPHYLALATTVWASLIGVVGFGATIGSMLPFALRRIGFDPATSSAHDRHLPTRSRSLAQRTAVPH